MLNCDNILAGGSICSKLYMGHSTQIGTEDVNQASTLGPPECTNKQLDKHRSYGFQLGLVNRSTELFAICSETSQDFGLQPLNLSLILPNSFRI